MATYRRVYYDDHLRADCQETGISFEPNACQSSKGLLFTSVNNGLSFVETFGSYCD